jgi:hypothetical protein
MIVDMQDYFFSEEPVELNEKICDKISEYREERLPIVVLEYRDNPYDPDDERCGPTNDTIKDELKGYGLLAVFGKDADGGAEFVRDYFDNVQDGVDEIELVGVNLDCCVAETAIGLARNHYDKQITIVEECCDSHSFMVGRVGYKQTVEDTAYRIENTKCSDNLRMLVEQVGEL